MSKLFTILKDLHLSSMDTGDYTAEAIEKAEQAIKDLMLELINVPVQMKPDSQETWRGGVNELKTALREKVAKL